MQKVSMCFVAILTGNLIKVELYVLANIVASDVIKMETAHDMVPSGM